MGLYRVTYMDGSHADVETRTCHQLAAERKWPDPSPGQRPELEWVMFILHRASGVEARFDDWVDTVKDWDVVKASSNGADADPPDPAPEPTSDD